MARSSVAGLRASERKAAQAGYGRPEQAVVLDILGVLVEADLDRRHEREATPHLVVDSDAATHREQRVLRRAVALQQPAPQHGADLGTKPGTIASTSWSAPPRSTARGQTPGAPIAWEIRNSTRSMGSLGRITTEMSPTATAPMFWSGVTS